MRYQKSASRAVVEPELHMINGVVVQAVYDMRSPDMLRAVDALCFWLSDECSFWLDACGYEPEPVRALVQAIYGARYAKTKRNKLIRAHV
jgi:hypothetical protein